MFLFKTKKDWDKACSSIFTDPLIPPPEKFPCLVIDGGLYLYTDDIMPVIEAYFEGYTLFSDKYKAFMPLIRAAMR